MSGPNDLFADVSKAGPKAHLPRDFHQCATTAHGAAMLAAGGQARRSPDVSDIGAEHDPRDAAAPEHRSIECDAGPATLKRDKRSRGPPWCRSAGTLEAAWRAQRGLPPAEGFGSAAGPLAVSRGERPGVVACLL